MTPDTAAFEAPPAPGLHACANPACRRWVSARSLYCCDRCDQPHMHSDLCDGRAAKHGEHALPDDVLVKSARISRALEVCEKRLAIEAAYAKLAPIISHAITDVDAIRARVTIAVDVLAQHVDRTTIPRQRQGHHGAAVAYPDEVA